MPREGPNTPEDWTAPLVITIRLARLAALALFQIALILGAPCGRLAWRGAHRMLPRRLHVGCGVSILLYAAFVVVLLARSGAVPEASSRVVVVLIWVLVAYFLPGIVLNGISRS